jgi:hypothetical protein
LTQLLCKSWYRPGNETSQWVDAKDDKAQQDSTKLETSYWKKPAEVLAYLCSYIHTVLVSRTLENCHYIWNGKLTLKKAQGQTGQIECIQCLTSDVQARLFTASINKQEKHQKDHHLPALPWFATQFCKSYQAWIGRECAY